VAKFLVTGGAGFIGSNLVDALIGAGDEVRVLDDLSSGKIENLDGARSSLELIEGSVTDPEVVRRAVEGRDYVLHHAALASVPRSMEDPLLNHRINVDGTLHLLLACREAHVKRFVLASSSAVYGEGPDQPTRETSETAPQSPYASSKLIGEQYCGQFTACGWVPTVCLRYFNVFGPRQDPASDYAAVIPIFVNRMLDGTAPTVYGDGEQTRDFVYVENVVRANLLAIEKESAVGQVVNIASGASFTVNDLYRRLAKILGFEDAPRHEPVRAGDVKRSSASIERARETLGYDSTVSYDVGLERTIAWFRDNQMVAGGNSSR
jgi:nucleoside-diphosphate-sugar epimerase